MQQLISGPNSLQSLPERLVGKKVALVTYGRARQNAGILRLIESCKHRSDLRHFPFSTPLLEVNQLARTAESILAGFSPDVFLSIGGGAVQDFTKCLKLIADCGMEPQMLLSESNYARKKKALHIAVPTTAGTGSEGTTFATVYEGETKHSVDDPSSLPSLVVLDPSLLAGVPRATAISCGFDALAQAMESIWSIHATEGSLADALEACEGCLDSFEAAVFSPTPAVLERMQYSAYLSGKAINVSRTTLAHALAYPLSARFGLPHGLAVFLNLPKVIRYNAGMKKEDCLDPRGIRHYQEKMEKLFALFKVADHEDLASSIESLSRKMGVSPKLEDHGVLSDAHPWMAESAAASSRSGNNPRRIILEALLDEII